MTRNYKRDNQKDQLMRFHGKLIHFKPEMWFFFGQVDISSTSMILSK